MHDVVEITRTVLCHTHLVVCQTCDWIAVSGRHQAVVLFLYSEHIEEGALNREKGLLPDVYLTLMKVVV